MNADPLVAAAEVARAGHLGRSIPVPRLVARRRAGLDLRHAGDRQPRYSNAKATLGRRGATPAFVGARRARARGGEAIESGEHRLVPPLYRLFFILPLEHHEDMASQARALALTEALAADAPEALKQDALGWVEFAVRHVALVRRFGRFPHRNAVLGRAPTAEEAAYLASGGETFGQGAAAQEESR